MKLGDRLRMIGGELLSRVSESPAMFLMMAGRRQKVEHLSYDQLGKAFETKPFVQRACELSTDILFSNGFKVKSADPAAAEGLARFWSRHEEQLDQAGIDGALYGNAGMVFFYDSDERQVTMRVEAPDGIKRLWKSMSPWKTAGYRIMVETEDGTYVQTITREQNEVRAGAVVVREANPYGLLPVVLVRERRRSRDENGCGVITAPVYDLCDKYGELVQAAFDGEVYHGNPILIFKGLKDASKFQSALADGNWGPEQGIELTAQGEAKFLESVRGSEGQREEQKLLFYGVVTETGIPQYMWGVKMEAAQASTSEQRDAVVKHAARRRRAWTSRLKEANTVLLTMLSYHTGQRFSTLETDIEWGAAVDADKKAEAETERIKVETLELAKTGTLMSSETAVRAMPRSLVPDPEAEVEKIAVELEELAGAGTTPTGTRTGTDEHGNPVTEATGAEGSKAEGLKGPKVE